MPLSPPVAGRDPIHTRAITTSSFARADGMWDIEGHLTDVKAYAFDNRYRGRVEAGEPVHDMWIRLTVDEAYVVRAVEAVTDTGPFEICPAITPAFQALVGLTIGPGWNRRVRERLGGVKGCVHLVDLLRPIATVAYHTVRWSRARPGAEPAGEPQRRPRPPINSCHAWASDGEVVKRDFPEHYSGT